mgnify:CR=1 FL=1
MVYQSAEMFCYIYIFIPSCVSALTHVLASARQLLGCRGSRPKERDISVPAPHQGALLPRGTRHLCSGPSSRGRPAPRKEISLSWALIKELSRPEERDIPVPALHQGAVSPRGTRHLCPDPSSRGCLAPRKEISLSRPLIKGPSRPEERDISVPGPHQGAARPEERDISVPAPHQGVVSARGTRHLFPDPSSRGNLALWAQPIPLGANPRS